MFREENTFNIGDEVIAIKDYDFKDDIIDVTGKVIGKGRESVTVFFYKDINGHGGTLKLNKDLKEKLAEKYNVPINNCWEIPNNIKFLLPANNKSIIKIKLCKLAKI